MTTAPRRSGFGLHSFPRVRLDSRDDLSLAYGDCVFSAATARSVFPVYRFASTPAPYPDRSAENSLPQVSPRGRSPSSARIRAGFRRSRLSSAPLLPLGLLRPPDQSTQCGLQSRNLSGRSARSPFAPQAVCCLWHRPDHRSRFATFCQTRCSKSEAKRS